MELGNDLRINSLRLRRVVADLFRHPCHLLPYFRDSLLCLPAYDFWRNPLTAAAAPAKKPFRLGALVPWFSYQAIDFLESYLTRQMKVFEWGAGSSSIFFARRCLSFLSVESDKQWYETICAESKRLSIGNVDIKLCEFDFFNPVDFAQSQYLHAITKEQYDVIVIDCPDFTFAERPVCLKRARENIKPGGVIIMDDSWRYKEAIKDSEARSIMVFEGVGPGRLGVTSTTFCFY